jgi:hypothetical protein
VLTEKGDHLADHRFLIKDNRLSKLFGLRVISRSGIKRSEISAIRLWGEIAMNDVYSGETGRHS